ncbi:protein shifted-like isoform X2 [Dreissena polymorpha]|uniref:protein shifted-like isoform X2 n=1 Tax=Dreissena polymorpha TaxID=45954 RepID=UPI002265026C|nr:protein shifted-like isoform X2 [Dreissena polymorpha]
MGQHVFILWRNFDNGDDLETLRDPGSTGRMNVSSVTCCMLIIVVLVMTKCTAKSRLNFWIDEAQLEKFASSLFDFPVLGDMHIIYRGEVTNPLNDNSIEFLRNSVVLPPEIDTVNLTWEAGDELYTYWFDELKSKNKTILYNPLLSIPASGIIPKGPKIFQVSIPCTGTEEGIAHLVLNLHIMDQHNKPVKGTPFKLRIKKQCNKFETTNLCKQPCKNNGRCNQFGECECPQGFHGLFCEKDMCSPKCENNALCPRPCQNGGRCVQPGVSRTGICWCTSGFFGDACQFSLCNKPCQHEGLCVGTNICKCKEGYSGDQCETGLCLKSCMNGGLCVGANKCECKTGYIGDQCEEVFVRPRRKIKQESEKCNKLKVEIQKRCNQKKKCKSKQNRIAKRCSNLKPDKVSLCKKRQEKLAQRCIRKRDKRRKRCQAKRKSYKDKCMNPKHRQKETRILKLL